MRRCKNCAPIFACFRRPLRQFWTAERRRSTAARVLPGAQDQPRVAAAACEYFRAVDGDFSEATFRVFILALQTYDPLTLDELWDLGSFLRFELLESILDEAQNLRRAPEETQPEVFAVRMKSLRTLNHVDWEFLIEPLIVFDALLRQDPAGAY